MYRATPPHKLLRIMREQANRRAEMLNRDILQAHAFVFAKKLQGWCSHCDYAAFACTWTGFGYALTLLHLRLRIPFWTEAACWRTSLVRVLTRSTLGTSVRLRAAVLPDAAPSA